MVSKSWILSWPNEPAGEIVLLRDRLNLAIENETLGSFFYKVNGTDWTFDGVTNDLATGFVGVQHIYSGEIQNWNAVKQRRITVTAFFHLVY